MNQRGFTLVELAIVLMIIGLLIGGVLRGQELLRNAEITSTIQQVKSYQGAIHSFIDAYNNFPGDMSTATKHLPGCNTANYCSDGNGDGILGDMSAGQGHFANEPWQPVDASITMENTQFWKHLPLAHFISGVTPNAGANPPAWGETHPVAKMSNAGFFIRYTNFNVAGFPAQWTGHILVLSKTLTGTPSNCITGFCTVSPSLASQIDRKMDDGSATTGDVWAVSSNWQDGCGLPSRGTNNPNGYDERKNEEICNMMFKVN